MEMVDTNIASEWTLSIGSVHGDNPTEYLKLGTQKGFDPKYVSQLWQAMSSFLHCELPKNATSAIEHYKAENKLRPKIEEVLNELDRLAEGTVVASMVFQQVSFDCVCGQRNSRSTAVLKLNDIFNCIKEGCKEQYRVEKMGEEFLFERHLIPVSCYNCGDANGLPYRQVCELDKGSEGWKFDCRKCGKENVFMWKLKQFKRNDKDDASLL
ncbi:MAG: hypothetical protein NVV83_16980 [Afipia sp.]|nr:hypothetical protein [Afipia sp.]